MIDIECIGMYVEFVTLMSSCFKMTEIRRVFLHLKVVRLHLLLFGTLTLVCQQNELFSNTTEGIPCVLIFHFDAFSDLAFPPRKDKSCG